MFSIVAAIPMVFALSLATAASAAPQRLDENDQPVPREASQPISKAQHRPAKRHVNASHASATVAGGAAHHGCVDSKTQMPRKCAPAMLTPNPLENGK